MKLWLRITIFLAGAGVLFFGWLKAHADVSNLQTAGKSQCGEVIGASGHDWRLRYADGVCTVARDAGPMDGAEKAPEIPAGTVSQTAAAWLKCGAHQD